MPLSHHISVLSILTADITPKSCKTSPIGLLSGHILTVSLLRDILYIQIEMHRLFPGCSHSTISSRIAKQVINTSSKVVTVLSVVLNFHIELKHYQLLNSCVFSVLRNLCRRSSNFMIRRESNLSFLRLYSVI